MALPTHKSSKIPDFLFPTHLQRVLDCSNNTLLPFDLSVLCISTAPVRQYLGVSAPTFRAQE